MKQDADLLFWQKAALAFAPERLELTILPTEQCNFRCTYCYEDFALGRMAPATVRGIKNLLARRAPELRLLQLRWFGGEPLLAFEVIQEVMGAAATLSAQHPALAYFGSMTTNGSLLTLDRAAQLCASGVRAFQITLDGPREFHDTTRVTRGGRGSYDRIHANLLALRESSLPLRIELRLHLTPHNLPHLDAYVDELCAQYLADERFALEFFPIEKLGGPNDHRFEVLDHDLAVETALRLRGRRSTGPLTMAEVGDHYVCYAAMANAFVIRADGRLGRCTTALADPRNELGRLEEDGSMTLNQGRVQAWLKGWATQDWLTLQCPLAALPDEPPPSQQ